MRTPRRLRAVTLLTFAATLFAVAAAACGSGTQVTPEPDPEPAAGGEAEPGVVQTPPAGATTVQVQLTEWSVIPDQATVESGQIYFLATNTGADAHELVVIRSELPPDQLPVEDGRVPEDEVDMIGEIEPFAAGSQASAVFDLEPGDYVLFCNVAEEEGGELESHYLEGMHAAFTVE